MAAQDQPSPHSPTRSSDAAAVAASKTVKAAGTFFPQTGKPDGEYFARPGNIPPA